jgi:hypothetical protein
MLPLSLAKTNYQILFVSISNRYELVRSEDGLRLHQQVDS